MKKSFLFGLVLCITSYANVFAQNFDETQLETMTNEFIQRAESSDALSLMTNIKSYYSSLSIDDKGKMLSYVTNKTSALLENEKKDDALAVIYLYQNLVDDRDEKLPTLLFIKGNIYADKVDSVHLKRTIDELNSGVLKSNKNAARYLKELDRRLIDLRNYIPSYKQLEGEWVINRMVWDKTETGNHSIVNFMKSSIEMSLLASNIPDVILRISNDQVADTISACLDKRSYFSYQLAARMAKMIIKNKDYYSQIVIPYASDSIYILWCSERINKNSPEFAGLLRGTVSATVAAVNAELAQKNKYSWSDSFWGGLASTAVEVGINSIIDAMFTPSKKMFAFEVRLKINNEYMLTGTLTYKFSKIKPEGVSKYEELHSNVKLARWLPESNAAFEGFPLIVHPSMDEESFKKDTTTRYYYCMNAAKSAKRGIKYIRAFNNEQFKWLQLYNDSLLRNQGYKGEYAVPTKATPYFGLGYDNLNEMIQKKYKLPNSDGLLVIGVDENSPTYVAGLKEDDVILSIDGKNIKDKNEMVSILENKRIGDKMDFRILRKKNQLDLKLIVTWK